jgi:hypothetical protein
MVKVVLFVVLTASFVVWAAVGFGAPAVLAPTITAFPPNPSNSHSAAFTYTDSQLITRFECSLDGAAFKSCGVASPSSKSFTGLPEGSHTFQVRAVSRAAASPAASYSWVIDTTAPRVMSIDRIGVTPTNAAAVRWTVTFREAVTGVASGGGNFSLAATGLSGPAIMSPVTGSGAVYTVTASTGTASGTLQLRLTTAGGIADPAGNGLAGVPFNGQGYTIDKTPPPSPSIISGPTSVWPSTNATFGFTDSEPGATFGCSLDGVAPATCSSPQTYTNLSRDSHTFSVLAVDTAGNRSQTESFIWAITGLPFTIAGTASGLLYPGAPFTPIALAITNPNSVAIVVTNIAVAVADDPGACANANSLEVQQSPASLTNGLIVPANASNWAAPSAFQPKVRLDDTGANQDACEGQTFTFSYTGSAHS